MPFQKGKSGNPSTQFKPGTSGNPGGRPPIVHALEKLGLDISKATSELIDQLLDGMRTIERTETSWRFCVEQLLHYVVGKPKETVDLNVGGMSPEQAAMLEALQMTPQQRRDALAQDSTERPIERSIGQLDVPRSD